MKTSRIIPVLVMLITLLATASWVDRVSAQIPKIPARCSPKVSQIYFVDSGQSVREVHPGSNGGNGYQLNLLGEGVDNVELVREKFMTSVAVIPGYTNSSQAKWQVFFEPDMGRVISSVKLYSKCWNDTREYQLTEQVKLTDQ